jgi:multiple sugar transport system substrate-binding protein
VVSRRLPWRRTGQVVAACGVFAMLATACVGASSTSENAKPQASASPIVPKEPTKPVTITFSSWVGESPQMQKFAEDFHKLHPNITVEFQAVSSDNSTQKLTTQIAGGTAPDTAFVDASAVQGFASHAALVNLDGYIAGSKTANLDDYVPGFLESAKYQGSTFALPLDGETTGLFYRTDLFNAAGIDQPPATWEEFSADAAKLTDTGKKQYGFIEFAPEASYYWWPFLWQAGGRLMTADGKNIAFNSPEGQQAANFYVDLAKYSPPDYYSSDSYTGRVAFAAGKVATYEAGAWFGGTMRTEYPKITGDWSVVPMPTGPAGCATTVAGDSLVVFSQSKNADAAWMWIDYLAQPAIMKAWSFGEKTTTLLPTRQSLLSDPSLGRFNPWLKQFADQMSCAVTENLTNPKWPQINDALNAELGKAIFGEQTATEALQKAADKANQILQSTNG